MAPPDYRIVPGSFPNHVAELECMPLPWRLLQAPVARPELRLHQAEHVAPVAALHKRAVGSSRAIDIIVCCIRTPLHICLGEIDLIVCHILTPPPPQWPGLNSAFIRLNMSLQSPPCTNEQLMLELGLARGTALNIETLGLTLCVVACVWLCLASASVRIISLLCPQNQAGRALG